MSASAVQLSGIVRMTKDSLRAELERRGGRRVPLVAKGDEDAREFPRRRLRREERAHVLPRVRRAVRLRAARLRVRAAALVDGVEALLSRETGTRGEETRGERVPIGRRGETNGREGGGKGARAPSSARASPASARRPRPHHPPAPPPRAPWSPPARGPRRAACYAKPRARVITKLSALNTCGRHQPHTPHHRHKNTLIL